MPLSETEVRAALRDVKYPGFSRDIVSFGLVRSVNIDSGEVKVQLALATNDPTVPQTIKTDAEKVLRAIAGVQSAKVLIDIHAPPAGAGAGVDAMRLPGVKHIIAVGSLSRVPMLGREAFKAAVVANAAALTPDIIDRSLVMG